MPSIPLCGHARKQLELVRAHCDAVAARLERLSSKSDLHPGLIKAQQQLLAAARGDDVPVLLLFMPCSGGRWRADGLREASSADCIDALPPQLGLEANLGRHYWQNALRAEGLPTVAIDAFVRHTVEGRELQASTCAFNLADVHAQLVAAQDRVLARLGLQPIAGLSCRNLAFRTGVDA